MTEVINNHVTERHVGRFESILNEMKVEWHQDCYHDGLDDFLLDLGKFMVPRFLFVTKVSKCYFKKEIPDYLV